MIKAFQKFYVGIFLGLYFFSFIAIGQEKISQEKQHYVAMQRITSYFMREHYKRFSLNEDFADAFFDNYIEMLDFQKNTFLAKDIENFAKKKDEFIAALYTGRIDIAYEIYNVFKKRRLQRVTFSINHLEKDFNWNLKKNYVFNRKNSDFLTTKEELDNLWKEKILNDAIVLKLTDKTDEKIKERLIKRYNYSKQRLDQTTSEDVFQGFVNAFAKTIEPHTSYLSPRNADAFRSEMNLSLEGIGAVLQAQDEYTVIRELITGGPAKESGQLKINDKITGVGQRADKVIDIVGWRLDDVVELIKGPKGTKVYLQISRGKSSAKIEIVEITRDKIRLEDKAAKYEELEIDDKKVGVITIPSFYVGLSLDIRKLLADINQNEIKNLIVDVRNNGGGSLDEATKVSGLFIKNGPIVQIRDQNNKITIENDIDSNIYYEQAIVVLVNRYSASASEIFAAAMQDYKRAIIVGEQTFGKGTVQQHRQIARMYDIYENPMGDIQFTIAKFYRVNGQSTQIKGVIPDIAYDTEVDPSGYGESKEEKALLWDTINKIDISKNNFTYNDIKNIKKKHKDRIKENINFIHLSENFLRFREIRDKTNISLNLEQRKKELQEQENHELKQINELRVLNKEKPLLSLDDYEEETETSDFYLQEAAYIALDTTNK